ncbi:MAG: amidase domain-containing protein [Oscillospiraceae bacterium]|nr:amidase domain-containing protein [Oscillospiraceae bacterium]
MLKKNNRLLIVVFLLLFIIFLPISKAHSRDYSAQNNKNKSEQFFEEDIDIDSYFHFAETLINSYYEFYKVKDIPTKSEIELLVDSLNNKDGFFNILETYVSDSSNWFFPATESAGKIIAFHELLETAYCVINKECELYRSSAIHLNDWRVIDGKLVLKLCVQLETQFSDSTSPSVLGSVIQLVIENKYQPVIADYYCEDFYFDQKIRGFGLDLFDSDNWLCAEDLEPIFSETYLYFLSVVEGAVEKNRTVSIETDPLMHYKKDVVLQPKALMSYPSFDPNLDDRGRSRYYAYFIVCTCPASPVASSSAYSYGDFSSNGSYDCTNFISHCMLAGNFSMQTGTYGWYFNSFDDRSAAWSSVNLFYEFVIYNYQSTGVKCSGYNATFNETNVYDFTYSTRPRNGDVLQVKYNYSGGYGFPSFGHSLLIQTIGLYGDIFVTWRSDSTHYGYNIKLATQYNPSSNLTEGSGGHLYRVLRIKYPDE